MALTAQAWELENSLAENALATGQSRSQLTSYVKDSYLDLYLPVQGNYKKVKYSMDTQTVFIGQ